MLNALRRLFLKFASFLSQWLTSLAGGTVAPIPKITAFTPVEGWPGSLVTIRGSSFSDTRDDVQVTIGGTEALIITASTTELYALAGESTVTGPVMVTVTSKGTATSATPFQVLPSPDVRDLSAAGPPVFFHGPQPGTPALGVADQPVLVVFTYPTDQNPGGPAQRAAEMAAERGRFEQARRFWVEASYGSTSWNFAYTDWLPLPADRNYYVWEARDTYFARFKLLEATRRGAAIRNGGVFATHIDELMVTVSVNNASDPASVSWTGKPLHGTAIRTRGTRAFVTAGFDGLWVYDLVNSPATFVKKVSTGAYFSDLDLAGSLLAVAALEQGLLLFDVSITALPTFRGAHVDGGQQVSAVRLAGQRAYIGIDTRLRVLDVGNPAAPFVLGEVELGGFVLDLALQDNLIAAATDGGGVVLVDVTMPIPTIRSKVLKVSRAHGVALAGNLMVVAGAGAGLATYDIANPAGPISLGSVSLSGDALNVIVDGARAYVSLGRRRMAVVDIGNPAAPAARGVVVLGPAGGGTAEPDLAALRANIDMSVQAQNLTQRHGALWVDALKAAQGAGFALNGFKGIVVVVRGPFLRGASGLASQFAHEDSRESVRLNDTKGTYYVATGATWGRIAHETGHWLGMSDVYEEKQSDGTLLRGTAAPWCLSGNCDDGPLFCGHQITDLMHLYRAGPPPSNVAELNWSPTDPPLDLLFEIVAHDELQNADPARVHVVRIQVSSGLLYFVEVRQRPATRIFDQILPGTDPATQAAVVVTRATQAQSFSNTFERPVMLMGVLGVGEKVVDAARGLTIQVDALVQARPAAYRVRVLWNQFVPGDPNGKIDLTITPWNTEYWDTPDIWIDSPRNNSGATSIYEFFEGGDNTRPRLNGDRPWVKHDNTIMARIRNTGPEAVNDVYVGVYTTSPPGIGDNGNWSLLETVEVPTIAGRDPAVPGSGEHLLQVRWQPAADAHSCVKVSVMPQNGEIATDNNAAQENVFKFDTPGSSSHDPVVIDAVVRSPFSIAKRIDLVARGLPYGWHVVADHNWVWTGPKGERAIRVVIWTDLNAPYSFTPAEIRRVNRHERIEREALTRIEGWTTFDHRYIPIGGLLADVKATRKVRFSWEVSGSHRGGIVGQGCLQPALPQVPITVEVTDRDGTAVLIHSVTDAQGCIQLEADLGLPPGDYNVQAFVTAGGEAAETETSPRTVRID